MTRPFEPFTIVRSTGQQHRVASPDYVTVNPHGSRLVAWFDDGPEVIIPAIHVAAIKTGTAAQDGMSRGGDLVEVAVGT
ncbi:MAG: hypothetical protein RMM51_11790 [Verrucomicrobiae bacterium]|nr:hypothetical protein [Verrucomicrobiae bacterium]